MWIVSRAAFYRWWEWTLQRITNTAIVTGISGGWARYRHRPHVAAIPSQHSLLARSFYCPFVPGPGARSLPHNGFERVDVWSDWVWARYADILWAAAGFPRFVFMRRLLPLAALQPGPHQEEPWGPQLHHLNHSFWFPNSSAGWEYWGLHRSMARTLVSFLRRPKFPECVAAGWERAPLGDPRGWNECAGEVTGHLNPNFALFQVTISKSSKFPCVLCCLWTCHAQKWLFPFPSSPQTTLVCIFHFESLAPNVFGTQYFCVYLEDA